NLLQVGAILPLVAVHSADRVWIVLLVAMAELGLGQFVVPAEQALLPRLVAEDELVAANSLNTLNRNIARLGGPALGGIVAIPLGLSGAAALDAASFAIAAGLVALIGGSFRAPARAALAVPAALAGAPGGAPVGEPLAASDRVIMGSTGSGEA